MNPNSKKPKFLDWIKERTGRYHEDFDPRAHGHETWKELYAEIREDEKLAKVRDETGREPECLSQKAKPLRGKSVER